MTLDPLTKEQRELRELVGQLARERIAPRAAEIDESHEFPRDVVELYRENEVFGPIYGEAHGGLGTGALLAGRDRGGFEGLRDLRPDPRRAGARLARAEARRDGELNEAFAARAVAVTRDPGLDADRVNLTGGAIALGRPVGATGAILTVKVMHELGAHRR